MEKNYVTVIGSLNYDILIKQQRMPYLGETFKGDELIMAPGGKGANQAVQCSKLGLETYMVGKVGNDYFGVELIESLKIYKTNTSFISKSNKSSTGIGVVHVLPNGNYKSTILPGTNYELSIKDIKKAECIIQDSKFIILQLEIPMPVVEYSISLASRYNCYIILNAAPMKKVAEKYLNMVDCLIVNEIESSFLINKKISSPQQAMEICDNLFCKIKNLVIITLGAKGSVAFDGKNKLFIPATEDRAIDTTGAGDSYIGALCYALFNNFPIVKAIEFATQISGISVTREGGQCSFPTIEQLSDDLLSKYINYHHV
jgi:ribokinase